MRSLLRPLFILITVALLAGPLAAQSPLPVKDSKPKGAGPLELRLTGEETGDQLDKILSSAGKDGRPVVVRIDPPVKSPLQEEKDELAGFVALIDSGINRGIAGMAALLTLPKTVAANMDRVMGGLDSDRLTLIPLPIVLGLFAGFLLRRALRRLRPEKVIADPESVTQRSLQGLQRLAIDIAAFMGYRVVSFITGKALLGLEGPYIATMLAANTRVSQVLAYVIAAHVLLYPYAGGHRLIPLPNAAHHFRMMIAYSFIAPVMHYGVGLIGAFGGTISQQLGWTMVWSSVATAFKVWWFWSARRDLAVLVMFGAPKGARVTPLRRMMANAVAPIFVASAIFIWLVARASSAAPAGMQWGAATNLTQFYVVLVPLFVTGAAAVAREWFAANPPRHATPLSQALRTTAVAGIASLVWVIATLDLGRVWSQFLTVNMGESGLGLLKAIVTAAITGVVGLISWIFLKALFDAYLPKQRSGLPGMEDEGDDGEPNIQSRLASVLPVIRGVALAFIVALTILFILTKLGVETGPLLAGFGIMGLALSFGSQALVRDVVSGIFFLADDAFRVGEYIDTGRLKGTVERITLRAVQLRHQSGLVHTIPYGQLQAVTNASRDWATVKFPIRLDHKADIEKARKIIKKIGTDMLSHEEFGTDFFLPVKMQGIQEIQDNAIVARIKFTAKPFRTSQIQREALKRIYLGLTEAGIPLATNVVSVRSGSPDAAAAAYANANATLPAPGAAPSSV